jgi:uncharacterized membrane protein YphA (DoxX/SURF4 family)
MDVSSQHAPRWIEAILGWPATACAARTALASAYLIGGIMKVTDFQAAVAEQAHFGLQPAPLWAALTIVVELVGPALLITGRYMWLAAGALSVLTAIAMLVANDFWAQQGLARFMALNAFFEHVGLIGGFALAAILDHRQKEHPND